MKIGFIGVGAMAQAIIQGLLNAKFVPLKIYWCIAHIKPIMKIMPNSTD